MTDQLIIDALATFRLTRLLTTDRVTATPRDWLQAHLLARQHRLAAYGISCDWCVSTYAAATIKLLGMTRTGRHVNRVLALSAAAGFLAAHT